MLKILSKKFSYTNININKSDVDSNVNLQYIILVLLLWLKGNEMDLEEVYLRQIVEQLKLQNKLKEDGNDLLKEILNKLGK